MRILFITIKNEKEIYKNEGNFMLEQLVRKETEKNKIQNYNKSKIRSSNIEVLRIVAMFMIIIYHIVCHTIIVQLTDLKSIERMNNGWFCQPIWYKRILLLELIMPFGIVGNAIFMLIAGYFGIEKNNDIKRIGKTGKKLILQILFVTIFLVLFSDLFYYFNKSNYISMIGLNYFNDSSWFVGYYFLVILISYLFLNKYLNKFSEQEYLACLIILFSIISFSWVRNLIDGFANGLSILCTGIFLYSLGGYIKKYRPFKNVNILTFIGIIVIANILLCISFHNATITNIENYMKSGNTGKYTYEIPVFANNNYIIITIAVCMFEIFKRLKIKNSKIINFVGASTFMIYLLHDNDFFYSLWGITDWITLLHNNVFVFMATLLLQALCTFTLGLIIYAVYIVIIKIAKKIRERKDEKIINI